jgi:predicted esterase
MILSLTRLNKSKNIVNLDPTQRDSLARDWMAVRAFLEAHLEYLRLRSKEVRDQGWIQGGMAAARALLNEQPLAALLVLGVLLALGIAVWRQVF